MPTKEFFLRFNTCVGSRLVQVSEELAKSYSKSIQPPMPSAVMSTAADAPKFIYFNTLNRATKSTVHLDSRKCGNVAVTQEMLKLLTDVYVDKQRLDFLGLLKWHGTKILTLQFELVQRSDTKD